MNILLIYLGIFVAILLIAIAVKVLKSIIKIAFFISFVVFIFLFISGYLVISDANTFKEEFPSSQKTFLLTKDGLVEAGFVLKGTQLQNTEFLDKETLDNLTEMINNGALDVGDNYKIFVADYIMFEDSLNEGVVYEDLLIDESLADEVFSSDDPLTVLAKDASPNNWKQARDELAKELGSTSHEVKGAFFAVVMTEGLSQGPTFLVENLKDDNLEVYPQSALFIALEVIPESVYSNLVGEKVTEGES